MSKLFTSVRIGRYTLPNRLVMAPMTRSCADDETGMPTKLLAAQDAPRDIGEAAGSCFSTHLGYS
ncbi:MULTISPECIES: NADH:flavin oxidoreductase/NADH oxidase [Brenneria]|uniref:NADH:flavin oxidoreductase/NADH oxidase n=1 Tax=Brenneria TaxID=71655 RepID=UPI00022F7525|nr:MULTISPECIES: NADH:flavin oxidoreductase/NADH oxidase [Brenneria]EHD19976.1 NADH:flavin oxidoreductase/NADH oxidase [Brenneria sp. EniD312]